MLGLNTAETVGHVPE